MNAIDVLSFCLSLLGISGPILLILYLLPRNVTPRLSTFLDETQQLLRRAEEIGAVPPQSEYKCQLDRSTNQFAMMRVESNHAQGTFNQLRISLLHGLTFRLYSLYYQIEAIKSELELKVDKQQLNDMEAVTRAEVSRPVGATATPVNNYVNGSEPILPFPVTAP